METCLWEHSYTCGCSSLQDRVMGRMGVVHCSESEKSQDAIILANMGWWRLALESIRSRSLLFLHPLSFQHNHAVLISQRVSELEVERSVSWLWPLFPQVMVISAALGAEWSPVPQDQGRTAEMQAAFGRHCLSTLFLSSLLVWSPFFSLNSSAPLGNRPELPVQIGFTIFSWRLYTFALTLAQGVKNLPAMQEIQEMWVWSLGFALSRPALRHQSMEILQILS